MASSSFQKIEEKILSLAEEDKSFRAALLANPKTAIKDKLNIEIPDGIELKVIEDTGNVYHIVLPPTSDELENSGVRW